MTIPYMPEVANPRLNAANVPVIPGPFAFLQSIGQGVGQYAVARDFVNQRNRAQAQQAANQALEARKAGLIPPSQFATPEMIALFRAAGMQPPSSEPTPEEQITALKGRVLSAVNSGRGVEGQQAVGGTSRGGNPILDMIGEPQPTTPEFSNEQLMLAGLPRSGLAKERVEQGIAGQQEATLAGGGAAARAQAGVVSGPVAEVAESKAIQEGSAGTAEGYISQQMRGLDLSAVANDAQMFDKTVDEAYKRYQSDALQGLVPQLPEATARQVFARALQGRLDDERKLEIAALRAARTGAGRTGNPFKDTTAAYEARIRGRTAQIDSKRKQIEALQKDLSPVAKVAPTAANGKDKQIFAGVAQLQKEIDVLDGMQEEDNRTLQSILSDAPMSGDNAPGAGVTTGRIGKEITVTQEQWDKSLEMVGQGKQIKGRPKKAGESNRAYVTRVFGERPK